MSHTQTSSALCGFAIGTFGATQIIGQFIPGLAEAGITGLLSARGPLAFLIAKAATDSVRQPKTMAVYAPAAFIGCGFGTGLAVVALAPKHYSWGIYVTALSFFHFSEYIMTSLYNADTVSFDSFLLNHSKPYAIAAVASWTEYWLEAALLPSMAAPELSKIGLVMVVAGETIRKLAMYTASSNFTHIVADQHKEGHQLVTHGIYRVSRHPSYMGWFWWSVGTQVVLCNPVCTVAYAVATYKFFSSRVEIEEFYLLRFFGKSYLDYQKAVGTGIPYVKGLTGLSEAEIEQFTRHSEM